jgi:S1-C subfamily serine protease
MRTFWFILGGLVLLGACLGIAAFLFPIPAAGWMGPGSGVYIGDGLLLSNQHVLEMVGEQSTFRVPGWRHISPTVEAPVREVVYQNRDIELSIARLGPSLLNVVRVTTPCLSTQPLRSGEPLWVTSSPHGTFPPVSAQLIVSDPRPLLRRDMDPIERDERYSAMTIVTTLSADQAGRVSYGSSGGPAFNRQGELVGLVWTGRGLGEGQAEVWITPVSAWLSHLRKEKIPRDVLEKVLDAQCPE